MIPRPAPFAARARFGRATRFRIEPADDPLFASRLVLSAPVRGRWLVLVYRLPATARPSRPMVRLVRSGGAVQDFVLPGTALGAAIWLGWLPEDLDEIRLSTGPGFVLEHAGLRSRASVFAECGLKRPARLVPALYACLRGDERRFRDILRGACAVTPLSHYAAWQSDRLRPAGETDEAIGERLTLRLVLPCMGSEAGSLVATVESLRSQTHRAWQVVLVGDAPSLPEDPRILRWPDGQAASPDALLGEADALGFLRPGDRLTPDALAILAAALAAPDAPDLVYADEEADAPSPAPRLKPDWSPDLALVTAYHGTPTLCVRALAERLPGREIGSEAGKLSVERVALSASSMAVRVAHVPRILCRTRFHGPSADHATALEEHLRATGSAARADVRDSILDLRWPLPDPAPLVSIVIPSRDRLDLIARVTQGVLRETDYPTIELVIVDNGSTDPAVLRLYDELRADPRVRIEAYPHPFNFSAMVNAGVRAARGDIVVLLNNDVAVLRPDWLDALVAQACRPKVGAVGAKLLYGDGRLQHAGVVVGLGGRAGHILRRRPGDAPGHLNRMRVAHEVSAVTAACLAVARAKYDAVGGFDETTFPVDFNDVDFCLRLGAAGWKTMWTPWATLSHLESVSRGPPSGAARLRFEREADAFVARWRDVIRHDPFYHPALSLTTFGEDLE